MYKIIVWTIVTYEDKILLLKKPDNSEWTLVGGHVEDNESSKMAIIRRTQEEVGLTIKEDQLEVLCVIDRKLDEGFKLHIFFKTLNWQGEPINKENDLHSELQWFKMDNLPENLGELAKAAVESIKTNKLYHFKDHIDHHNRH